jgi:acetyl-CoA carboxylase biotin carboxyl carrier protein
MDAVERVRQLIDIMSENDLAEIEVEEPDLRIKLRKNVPTQYVPPGFGFAPYTGVAPAQGEHHSLPAGAAPAAEVEVEEEAEKLIEVPSPMVGTFYRSSTPGSEPYVGIGSEVEPDTVVCIIEAMKVMNEIKAEVTGRIAEILVEDTEPIEFGQVLFLVEPTDG